MCLTGKEGERPWEDHQWRFSRQACSGALPTAVGVPSIGSWLGRFGIGVGATQLRHDQVKQDQVQEVQRQWRTCLVWDGSFRTRERRLRHVWNGIWDKYWSLCRAQGLVLNWNCKTIFDRSIGVHRYTGGPPLPKGTLHTYGQKSILVIEICFTQTVYKFSLNKEKISDEFLFMLFSAGWLLVRRKGTLLLAAAALKSYSVCVLNYE